MTLVKDDKLAAESKSKQDNRKEKKTASDPVEKKKTVEIVVEDQDLSGPSSGVREGFNKNSNNDKVDVTFVTLRLEIDDKSVLMRINFFVELKGVIGCHIVMDARC